MKQKVRVGQYARSKGVSEKTIRRLLADKVIPFTKLGRMILIDAEAADAALEKFTRKAVAK
jgi:excisionase family DNA binding protein